jgi:4-amino-4-deoxy-L-arabinose transferase-like glycosyltransferase
MLILPAALLLLFFALFTASSLRVSGRPFYLLAVYMLACAADVLVFEIAGLLRWLGNPALFLALQAGLTFAAGIIWRLRGKPHLLGPFAEDFKHLDFTRLGPSIRRHPALWLLTLAVDLAYAVNAYLILVVPPNNNDSLYLHMARVVRWLQTGSFLPYPTSFSWQIFYAFNAQSLIHWTVLFWDSDQLAGFVQFSAALVCMLCVYILARQLRFSRPQGIFAALIWATFPQVFLQSTTTQNDLVPAAFFAGALVFLVEGFRSSDRRPGLVLSALGLGLALGAKQTVFFLLPGLAGLILLLAWKHHSRGWAFLARWIPSAALAFSLVGALVYIENSLFFGNPMGESESVAQVFRAPLGKRSANLQPAEISVPEALWINLNRIAYQFIDTTGLPPLIEGYLFRGKAHLARAVYSLLNIPLESSLAANPNTLVRFDFLHRPPIQEDETWFGILAPFLMIPAGLVTLARSYPRRDPLPTGLWLVAISFVLLELLLRPGWDAYLGRNFNLAVVVLAPFMAAVYHPARQRSATQIGVWIITVLAVYTLISLTLNNTAKPLVGQNAIWMLNRSAKVTLENYQLKEPAQLVEANVPPDAILALPGGTWEYPFYDAHFHRRLIQVTSPEQYGDIDWLHEQSVNYLLVRNASPPVINAPVEWLAGGEEWTLYRLP